MMTSYRCIVVLLAFLFCLSSAAPITFSMDSSSSIDGIDNIPSSTIYNEKKLSQESAIAWSTMERTASSLFQDFFQKYTTLSSSRSKAGQASSSQHSSNLRRRIARRRHP